MRGFGNQRLRDRQAVAGEQNFLLDRKERKGGKVKVEKSFPEGLKKNCLFKKPGTAGVRKKKKFRDDFPSAVEDRESE